MAGYFLDSSALIKRFVTETGSGWVLGLFRLSGQNSFFIARITPVEAVAGMAKRQRIGDITVQSFEKASRRLMRGISDRFGFSEADESLVEDAVLLVKRHGLRGFDGIQLASAIRVDNRRRAVGATPLIFVSADNALNSAARAEGLTVENPNNHP